MSTSTVDRYGFTSRDVSERKQSERPPPHTLTKADISNEREWMAILNLDKRRFADLLLNQRQQIKAKCRRGIPQTLRGRAWYRLSFHDQKAANRLRGEPDSDKDEGDLPYDFGFYNTAEAETQGNEPEGDHLKSSKRRGKNKLKNGDESEKKEWSLTQKTKKSRYDELYKKRLERGECSPAVIEEVEKDLRRQFPDHELFSELSAYSAEGCDSLRRVLLCYTLHSPEIGYCQAMAPLAGCLLMHMQEEFAFWTFVQLCEQYLKDYFSEGLKRVQADGEILHLLLKKYCPVMHKFVKAENVLPTMYMVEWFMCCFVRTLPWGSALRVLDMFFFEGVKVLFKVAICVIQIVVTRRELSHMSDKFELLQKLKCPDKELFDEATFIPKVIALSLHDSDLMAAEKKLIVSHPHLFPS